MLQEADYYTRRAVEEHQRAIAAKDTGARRAHLRMAAEYERLAARGKPMMEAVPGE